METLLHSCPICAKSNVLLRYVCQCHHVVQQVVDTAAIRRSTYATALVGAVASARTGIAAARR